MYLCFCYVTPSVNLDLWEGCVEHDKEKLLRNTLLMGNRKYIHTESFLELLFCWEWCESLLLLIEHNWARQLERNLSFWWALTSKISTCNFNALSVHCKQDWKVSAAAHMHITQSCIFLSWNVFGWVLWTYFGVVNVCEANMCFSVLVNVFMKHMCTFLSRNVFGKFCERNWQLWTFFEA